jgi:hypothetical protein
MEISKALLAEHSKLQSLKIAGYIEQHHEKMKELIALVTGSDRLLSQRASWVMSILTEDNPSLLKPFIRQLIHNLSVPQLHPAVIRNTYRSLLFCKIPETEQAAILDRCFENIRTNALPLAVRVFSIGLASNLCQPYPELKRELTLLLRELQKQSPAPSLQSKIRNTLKFFKEC